MSKIAKTERAAALTARRNAMPMRAQAVADLRGADGVAGAHAARLSNAHALIVRA
jgi:hypothetical protein